MEKDPTGTQELPRIVPTRCHCDAIVGLWTLDGEMIRLMAEPGTGVLVAFNANGERVNPLRVISHGKKTDDSASL